MMQSAQKRCRHSLVVIVFFNMSRQMGHMSSLCRERGDTAISRPSVMASCPSETRWKRPSTLTVKTPHFKTCPGPVKRTLACGRGHIKKEKQT